MKRYWIKLYIEILDDDKFGTLQEFMKWRAIELFLVAGENGDDGLLPPVARLAWRLRLPSEKLEESLSVLSQVGIVEQTPDGWKVTNFKKRQYSESYERVKRYRNAKSNAVESDNESISISISDPLSLKEGGVGGENNIRELEFITRFGKFHGVKERNRWDTLCDSVGFEKAQEIAGWAEKKEIHMDNRASLLDSMETAAKTWREKTSPKKSGKTFFEKLKDA